MRFGFWRNRRERELEEEIESHLRMAADDLAHLHPGAARAYQRGFRRLLRSGVACGDG